MIEVTCPKCNGKFRSERPQIDIVMKCPYCSADLRLKGYSAANAMPASDVADKVRTYEKIYNILWVVVGVYQIILGLTTGFYITVALGVYNACMTINGFRSLKNITASNQHIIKWYEDRFVPSIIMGVINLLFGGVIGAGLCAFNLYIRHYVLQHRYAFEGVR